MRLGDAKSNQPAEVLEGSTVIQARLPGVNKGVAARHVLSHDDATMIAIGADRPDEDLFSALPNLMITIAVGSRHSSAGLRVEDSGASVNCCEACWRTASIPAGMPDGVSPANRFMPQRSRRVSRFRPAARR